MRGRSFNFSAMGDIQNPLIKKNSVRGQDFFSKWAKITQIRKKSASLNHLAII